MYSKNILIPKQLEMEILTCTHYLGLFKDDNDQTLGLTVGNFPYKFFEKNHKYSFNANIEKYYKRGGIKDYSLINISNISIIRY